MSEIYNEPYYKCVIVLSIYVVKRSLLMWSSFVCIFGIVMNISYSLARRIILKSGIR